MPTFTIVYGPPKSGKTLNARALMEHYGCSVFCDGDPLYLKSPRLNRFDEEDPVLILSTSEKVYYADAQRTRVEGVTVPVSEAARALGSKWEFKPDPEPPPKSSLRVSQVHSNQMTEFGGYSYIQVEILLPDIQGLPNRVLSKMSLAEFAKAVTGIAGEAQVEVFPVNRIALRDYEGIEARSVSKALREQQSDDETP